MNNVINMIETVKTISWTVIIGGLSYIVYRRLQKKIVTFKEVKEWAETYNDGKGKNCFVSKLSVMPEEVRKQVQKEIGLQRIINGYKDETSVFATITDVDNNIITSCYFLGTNFDEDLQLALTNSVGINLKLN